MFDFEQNREIFFLKMFRYAVVAFTQNGLKMALRVTMWKDFEVEALLAIWAMDAIKRQLSASYRKEGIYQRIERELLRKGIVWEWK